MIKKAVKTVDKDVKRVKEIKSAEQIRKPTRRKINKTSTMIGDTLYNKELSNSHNTISINEESYSINDTSIAPDFLNHGSWGHKKFMQIGMAYLTADGSFKTVWTAHNKKHNTFRRFPLAYDTNSGVYRRVFDESYRNWIECVYDGHYISPQINLGAYINSLVVVKSYQPTTYPLSTDKRLIQEARPDMSTFMLTEGKQYTFGAEFEVCYGGILTDKSDQYYVNCTRDGSLNNKKGGPEYATGVLQGDAGIMHLQKICNEITRRSEIDRHCGMHIHIGNLLFSRHEVICAYKLGQMLQSELFSIMPESRRNNEYCKTLPNLQEFKHYKLSVPPEEFKIMTLQLYDKLFQILSGNKASRQYNKLTQHPKGAHVGWDRSTMRYCWLNMVPSMFNTREKPILRNHKDKRGKIRPDSYTFEFRCHYGTTQFMPTLMWLLTSMAFCNYVENYQSIIISRDKITLKEVLTTVYPKGGLNIWKYYDDFKKQYSSVTWNENNLYDNESARQHGLTPLTIKELLKQLQNNNYVYNISSSSRDSKGLGILA